MKALVDLIPVICFVVAYTATHDLFLATGVLIGVTALQLVFVWFTRKKIEKPLLYTALAVFLLGGLTVFFKDGTFIKWKPTVIYWLFAVILAGSHFIGEKPIVRRMMESMLAQMPDTKFEIPARAWTQLGIAWSAFFATLGGINLFVAFHFSEATWVNFKLFGLTGILMVFVFAQILFLQRFSTPDSNSDEQKGK
ncbi:Intracellular septation protein A [gamma proteobacterium HdN1]|nr:Intracellular septation protein A [gamma proteobacterium HdN1]